MSGTSEASRQNSGDRRVAKSGRQIGQENLDRLRSYLDKLVARGGSLPLRGGQPNLSVIAAACGFDRQVLYKNAPAKALFEQVVSKMTLALRPQPASYDSADVLVRYGMEIQTRDRRIKHLEEKLLTREAEIEEMRGKMIHLKTELKCLRAHEEHLLETGRRVIR